MPEGTYGRVAPRSGLAGKRLPLLIDILVKHGLDVGAGVIDADYRGPVGIVMFNLSDKDFKGNEKFINSLIILVEEGDRIAQLIIEKIEMCECVLVDNLDDSARGSGSFGSSGMQ